MISSIIPFLHDPPGTGLVPAIILTPVGLANFERADAVILVVFLFGGRSVCSGGSRVAILETEGPIISDHIPRCYCSPIQRAPVPLSQISYARL